MVREHTNLDNKRFLAVSPSFTGRDIQFSDMLQGSANHLEECITDTYAEETSTIQSDCPDVEFPDPNISKRTQIYRKLLPSIDKKKVWATWKNGNPACINWNFASLKVASDHQACMVRVFC